MLHLLYLTSHMEFAPYQGSPSVLLVCLLRHQDHSHFNYSGSVFKYRVCWSPLLSNPCCPILKQFSLAALVYPYELLKKKVFNLWVVLELCPVQGFLLRVVLLTTVMCPCSFNFILYQIKIYFWLPVVVIMSAFYWPGPKHVRAETGRVVSVDRISSQGFCCEIEFSDRSWRLSLCKIFVSFFIPLWILYPKVGYLRKQG